MYIDQYLAYLAQPLATAGNETTVFVDRITTIIGETVETADFAALGRGIVTINPQGDGQTDWPEIASFTAVNATTLAFTGVKRGLTKAGVSNTAFMRYYPAGTPIIISVTSQTLDDLVAYVNAAVAGTIGTASDTAAGTTKLTQSLGTLARAQAALVTQQVTAAMTMQVKKFAIGDFVYAGGNSPTFVAPTLHPRIDLLAYDRVLNTIIIKQGTEATSPAVPQMSGDYISLAYIYNTVGETSIKDVTDGTNGYIYMWCELSLLDSAGTVTLISKSTIDAGYLAGDGSSYPAHLYPELARAHSGRYGYGTGIVATFNASTDLVTATAHGFVNGDIVLFGNVGGALPGGITANTPYYVIGSTTNTFQISTTKGGTALDITTAGTGTTTAYGNLLLPDTRSGSPLGSGAKTNVITFDATVGGVNVSTDQITIPANSWLFTGQPVVLAAVSGGTLPTGLTAGTYWPIVVDSTHIRLATSLANAQNLTPYVDITVAGTGSATLTQTLTTRSLGDIGGEETHPMNINELLAHFHTYGSPNGGTSQNSLASTQQGAQQPSSTVGGNVAMNNMHPYWVAKFQVRY